LRYFAFLRGNNRTAKRMKMDPQDKAVARLLLR